jgi:hypothetical protein
VNVNDGGTVSPGDDASVAALTTGAQKWEAGGTYVWNLADDTVGGGTSGDVLHMPAATLTVNATALARFKLKLDSLGHLNNFDPNVPQTWVVADAGNIVGFESDNFQLDWSSFADENPLNPSGTFKVGQSGSNVVVSYVIPEPGSAVVIGAFGMMLAGGRRRKQK